MVVILQWNTRSFIANGQKFKHFIDNQVIKPDVLCVQETWLKPHLDFVTQEYVITRQDREEGNGGVCDTFIKTRYFL